jgi:hypothetical protein
MAAGAQEAVVREMTALAHSAAKAVNVCMSDRVSDLLVWSRMNAILEALEVAEVRESTQETLLDLVKLSHSYEAVILLDNHGKCVVTSSPHFANLDLSSDPLFTDAMKGNI